MMFTSQLFQDIVRPCNNCGIEFDGRLHSPHILSCSHTFCLMCLSKSDQRKKRHCFQCKTKYSKFAPNVALIEVVQRIEERRKWLDQEVRKCDECASCVPSNLLRKCETCETHFSSRTDVSLDCVICLECCVNSHNGHKLRHVRCGPPSVTSSPVVKLRSRQESTSSVVSYNLREQQKNRSSFVSLNNAICGSLKRLSFRRTSKDFSFLMAPSSRLSYNEEDVVRQSNTPFFENSPSVKASSARYICNDTISVDSVFDGSPQSTIMHQSSNNQSHSPISLRLFCPSNDSGIHSNTPPSRFSRSSVSLCPNPSSSTPIYPKTSSQFSTGRPRVRMGVSDLINSRDSANYSPSLNAANLKSTRSESSVCHIIENPEYDYV